VNRDSVSTLTAAILRRVQSSGMIPTIRTGETVLSGTTPTVRLAGDPSTRQAQALGDPAGVGETVWVMVWRGTALVLGRAGGTRLYGYATATANQTGITTQTALTDLTVDVVVTQPNRVLHIVGQVQALATTSADIVIGSVQQDGVDVGRYGRFRAAAASDSQLLSGYARVEGLDPGGYTFRLTLQRTGGGTVTASNATTPGLIDVVDAGPVVV